MQYSTVITIVNKEEKKRESQLCIAANQNSATTRRKYATADVSSLLHNHIFNRRLLKMKSPAPDDEVVAEYDLLLSCPPENSDLHVLQYPLRHAKVGIGNDRRITAVNLRPNHGRVEVKLSVLPTPTDGDTEFGTTCRSFDDQQPTAHQKQIGTEQTLRSGPHLVSPECNYAIAQLRPGTPTTSPSFILVPVRAVSKLRPTFDYLDQRDLATLRQRAEDKTLRANARGEGGPPKPADDDDEAVTVGFRRRETERAAERRRSSHSTLRQREEGEAWVQLSYSGADSTGSAEVLSSLFNAPSVPPSNSPAVDPSTRKDYTALYLDHTRAERLNPILNGTDAEPTSRRTLERMTVNSAVSQVIRQARIAKMRDIVRLVGPNRLEKDIFNATRLVAMCVRGCWVAKKGLRIPGEGTAKDRYEAGRALIIDLFRRSRVATSMEACLAVGQPPLITEATIKSVLLEIAVERRGRGWELRLEDDEDFQMANKQLCRQQDSDWDRRLAAARDTLAKGMRNQNRRANI